MSHRVGMGLVPVYIHLFRMEACDREFCRSHALRLLASVCDQCANVETHSKQCDLAHHHHHHRMHMRIHFCREDCCRPLCYVHGIISSLHRELENWKIISICCMCQIFLTSRENYKITFFAPYRKTCGQLCGFVYKLEHNTHSHYSATRSHDIHPLEPQILRVYINFHSLLG